MLGYLANVRARSRSLQPRPHPHLPPRPSPDQLHPSLAPDHSHRPHLDSPHRLRPPPRLRPQIPHILQRHPPPARPLKKYFKKEENFRSRKLTTQITTLTPHSTTFSPSKNHVPHPFFAKPPVKTQLPPHQIFLRQKPSNATIEDSRCVFATSRCSSPPTLTGCGYHQAGSATHIPANIRTLAVPIFATNAQAYHTEMAFTQATIRELNTRTKYQHHQHRQRLRRRHPPRHHPLPDRRPPHLRRLHRPILQLSRHHHRQSLLTAHDGHILYRNDSILYREQFQSTQDLSGFIQEDGYAIKRVAREFAQAIVSDMLESF